MKNAKVTHNSSPDFASMSKEELVVLCGNFQQQIHAITQQLDWFKRQLFGQKSEKRDFAEVPQQVNMAELFGKTAAAPAEPPKETITYQRAKP